MRPFRRLITLLACLAIPGFAAGCDTNRILGEERFVLYVAPHTVECTGEGIHQCMLTRRSRSEEWTYFYGGIEGFTYEPGFHWTLRVQTRRIANPPADGSSIEYRLVEVVEKLAVPAAGRRPRRLAELPSGA